MAMRGYSVFTTMLRRIRHMLGKRTALGSGANATTTDHTEPTSRRRLVAPTDTLCAVTDTGRVRDHNEDTFYITDNGQVLIVADGMGGHKAGEVASALA